MIPTKLTLEPPRRHFDALDLVVIGLAVVAFALGVQVGKSDQAARLSLTEAAAQRCAEHVAALSATCRTGVDDGDDDGVEKERWPL